MPEPTAGRTAPPVEAARSATEGVRAAALSGNPSVRVGSRTADAGLAAVVRR